MTGGVADEPDGVRALVKAGASVCGSRRSFEAGGHEVGPVAVRYPNHVVTRLKAHRSNGKTKIVSIGET
jgi:hypothetical protein